MSQSRLVVEQSCIIELEISESLYSGRTSGNSHTQYGERREKAAPQAQQNGNKWTSVRRRFFFTDSLQSPVSSLTVEGVSSLLRVRSWFVFSLVRFCSRTIQCFFQFFKTRRLPPILQTRTSLSFPTNVYKLPLLLRGVQGLSGSHR